MMDRYCYPGTNVLVNTFDIRDPEKLKVVEMNLWINDALELPNRLPKDLKFDLPLWRLIHKETFGNVYPWAGEIREVMISKGKALHASPKVIIPYTNQLLKGLASERFLKGLDEESFLRKGSHYFEEMNAIHPFREGNTRTLKLFFSLLSRNAGYDIDWTKVSANQYERAEQASFSTGKGEASPFYQPLKAALQPADPTQKKSISFRL